jgi:hypothetical protein
MSDIKKAGLAGRISGASLIKIISKLFSGFPYTDTLLLFDCGCGY